jgi:hypothetical protein
MAIIPPLDISKDPGEFPDAPASESAAALPAEEATSPANGPLPGCNGAEVAMAEKYEATELEAIAGVRETNEVVADGGEGVMIFCAIASRDRKFSAQLRRTMLLILERLRCNRKRKSR